MTKRERDFRVGDICFYHEDGGIIRCDVVETSHDEKWLRFKLRVLEVLMPDRFGNQDPEIGEMIDVSKDETFSEHTTLIWQITEFAPSLN